MQPASKTVSKTYPRIWITGLLLLIGSGVTFRLLAHTIESLFANPIPLPRALAEFPRQIGNWSGTDTTLPTTTREYMETNFADDYLSRRYEYIGGRQFVDLYLVYCASRPSGILGHRPRICYTAHGWTHDQTEPVDFYTPAGRKVTALMHHFHKPGALGNDIYVMHFYVLNGQISTEEDRFSGFFGRRPNLSGDPARYVAQVQISSMRQDDILSAAQEMTEVIFRYLPGTEPAAPATPGS